MIIEEDFIFLELQVFIARLIKLDEELAKTGNSFLRLILECIWVWSKWFPVDPDTSRVSVYRVTLEKLVRIGP